MTPARIAELRQETVDMFYHGFDNYMNIAFPEDELRPITCVPLTRDQHDPRHVELNDVLGNYSLTLIDSLSTLAILASAPPDQLATGAKALRDFQDGVQALVQQYGDGTKGTSGRGLRARGFDVDSKVQVFETVIRGVGGLVSAHLFASGELPITGYEPRPARHTAKTSPQEYKHAPILWPNGLSYNGQLLRLALDLAERLLPAFYTATGMPYPRVNLRHGIPFYVNSPLHEGSPAQDPITGAPEITETCSAGAGSLVLEFTTLSRLSGDQRFEQLAKRAFWAVWNRRSAIGLIGAGVDAENGQWIGPYAGIGAGADSFFEYALKTSILLSGHNTPNVSVPLEPPSESYLDPNTIYNPLSDEENSAEAFLNAWHEAHAAIKRHLYSGTHHPHYVNAHLSTGSPQAYWIDSLGAYYPGLLALAGEVEEAIETNLLYAALWTRYSALPERWSVRDGGIEGGLGWWPGRPEFIESTYHLYRATRDPWYLHVGEMVLEDIKRRCWTECGWSGLQDVRTGEKSDRMESFFLGETAKYLYLLFDPEHPLNSLDAAYVFTTEGHPLLLPRDSSSTKIKNPATTHRAIDYYPELKLTDTCPVAPAAIPFTVSAVVARKDFFHAASLIGLHAIPNMHDPVVSATIETLEDDEFEAFQVPEFPNYTYYPWTLPQNFMPTNGTCDRLPVKTTFTIEFPNSATVSGGGSNAFNLILGPQSLVRLNEGLLIKSISGLKMGMVHESPSPFQGWFDFPVNASWRVWNLANMPLGRDEKVFIPRDIIGDMTDPAFTRVRNSVMLDLVIQLENSAESNNTYEADEGRYESEREDQSHTLNLEGSLSHSAGLAAEYKTMLSSLLHHVTSALRDPATTLLPQPQAPRTYQLASLPAIVPTGKGAAPVIDAPEAIDPNSEPSTEFLSWRSIYFAGYACDERLPEMAAKNHQVIVMRRGGCTFSEKLENIPSFTPSARGLKLVVMVSDPEEDDIDENGNMLWSTSGRLIRPLLDKAQVTPSGLLRHHQISMVMIGGGDEAMALLKDARSLGIRRRYHIESQGLVVGNIIVV
ncbi:glycosyl hydrolase family 47 protein [Coleophoma crateriformis]|uniref:alpha-1,2-Mannosidase n=1 Tax=Coleophoma crateriformis TaxID=565419 RepID=A0A3D8RQ35_9HELO|nr:glycosyl hydrolase family 47 protein [Coleophoma crateriformis]